jgi:hypothetical protein
MVLQVGVNIMSEIEKETIPEKPLFVENEPQQDQPALGELFLAGPVLPICSPSFYRHAVKRSAFAALVFFVIFGLLVAVLQTVRVTAGFGEARTAIDDAFASGEIPEVIIEGGEATVNAAQPFIAVDDGRSLVVLDTTGEYTGRELIDGRYETGMILTRDTIYGFDEQGRFTQMKLSNIPFKIQFNATLLRRFIDLAQTFVFIGLFIWRAVLGPLYIALLALGVWAVTSLVKKKISFSAVLITGFFAAIPAMYGEYLLVRINADVFLLYTLLLIVIWAVGLVSAVGTRRAGDLLRGERTLRAWRALIGVPMLVIFALDFIFNWEQGPLIIWVTALVTVIVLAVVGYTTGMLQAQREVPDKVALQR